MHLLLLFNGVYYKEDWKNKRFLQKQIQWLLGVETTQISEQNEE